MPSYVVDPATVPWKACETEGIAFRGQVLLSGSDGGPEALRLRFEARPSVYAHMHLTSQFQLLLGGSMDFPRDSLQLRPPGVHYTDHNTPYGPFSVGEGHDVLVLHPKQGGLMTMGNRTARREINLTGRVLHGMAKDVDWRPMPEAEATRYKVLIPHALGPEAVILECPPRTPLPMERAPYGRYEVVLQGSMFVEGRELPASGFRYVQGSERPDPIEAGPDGATLILLSFDQDAIEGGLTGQGIAVEASEAMARAI